MIWFLIMQFLLRVQSPWILQTSGTTERLRGVSSVNDSVAWASGNHGTVLRTTDGGETWIRLTVPGADSLDFRDIDAFSADDAYVMSIGPGESSRIYSTTDGGRTWRLSFINRDPRAFYDAMTFWDFSTGMAMGDAVDGRLTAILTSDGGHTWTPVVLPEARDGEGAFAASGTCIAVFAAHVWIGSGVNCARVYHSGDRGATWSVTPVPIYDSTGSSGIFSVCPIDERHAAVVGGDYRRENLGTATAAFTSDGGKTWLPSRTMPGGFRSCIARIPTTRVLVAVGPTGSDVSYDDGLTWHALDPTGFHAVSFASPRAGWAVGENGRIGRFSGFK